MGRRPKDVTDSIRRELASRFAPASAPVPTPVPVPTPAPTPVPELPDAEGERRQTEGMLREIVSPRVVSSLGEVAFSPTGFTREEAADLSQAVGRAGSYWVPTGQMKWVALISAGVAVTTTSLAAWDRARHARREAQRGGPDKRQSPDDVLPR